MTATTRDAEDRKLWDAILADRKLPGILYKAIDGCWKYRDDPASLRPLARVTQLMKEEADRSRRSNRRDGRIAESWVLLSLLINTDLTTLQVGYPGKGGTFVHRTCAYLARSVGMADPVTGKPLRRYQRAFKRLQNASLMTQIRRAEERDSGAINQKAAIKSMSADLVVALLGGTKVAEDSLSKARGDQYQYTKAKREAMTGEQRKAAERDELFSAVEAKICTKRQAVEKAVEKAAPTARQVGDADLMAEYKLAREASDKAVLAKADHTQGPRVIMDMMRASFPTFDSWKQQRA